MTFRILTPEDAASFQALRLRGLLEAPTAFASSYEEEANTPLSDIERRLQPKASGAIFGAFAAGALSAVAGVERESMAKLSHKAYLWGMYVAPEHRLRGLGRRLLEHVLPYAWQSLRVAQVNLGVHTENESAIALYRRLGFVVWGTEAGALMVHGKAQDEHHMVCRAPPTV